MVAGATGLPTLIGSGITPENLADFACADGFIVGSYVKEGGLWSNRLDLGLVEAVVQAFRSLAV
jgi:predicted TIM-barrel enzyme